MKYPRTYHLPWSEGSSDDDKVIQDISVFDNKCLVYYEKLDGENTVMSRNVIHARSETGYNHEWQTYLKNFWGGFRFNIPENYEICGENMYAVHSIQYDKLDSYFYVFNIFDTLYKEFLSHIEVVEFCEDNDLKMVPKITFSNNLKNINIPEKSQFGDVCEGYVARNVDGFCLGDFHKNVAKCVRKDHIQTDIHWTKSWKKHILRESEK